MAEASNAEAERPEAARVWFCYMARCADGALYVGIATDVAERIREHNWGVGAAFTKVRRPVELIWFEECTDMLTARRRELELKGWRREKKLRLISAVASGSKRAVRRKTPNYPSPRNEG
jgi:putative endonuclease